LKQAPRAWFARLTGKLVDLSFIGSKADSSLFIYHTTVIIMYLLIYVDDIIIVSSVSTAIDELLQLLSTNFAVKDLEKLHYFLGIEVIPVKDGLLLSQQCYIRDLLSKTNMTEAKSVSSPMFQPYPHLQVILWKSLLYIEARWVHFSTYLLHARI